MSRWVRCHLKPHEFGDEADACSFWKPQASSTERPWLRKETGAKAAGQPGGKAGKVIGVDGAGQEPKRRKQRSGQKLRRHPCHPHSQQGKRPLSNTTTETRGSTQTTGSTNSQATRSTKACASPADSSSARGGRATEAGKV